MLVLSRKRGEQILIGDDIVVTVVECTGNRIKVGIEAPRSVRVVRTELNHEIEREPMSSRFNPLACGSNASDLFPESAALLAAHPR